MKIKLTKRVVDNAKSNGIDSRIFDAEIPGFHLRLKPSGVKSYALKYRSENRQRSITIGRHGILTPDQARIKARELLAAIGAGGGAAILRLGSKRNCKHHPSTNFGDCISNDMLCLTRPRVPSKGTNAFGAFTLGLHWGNSR